MSAVLLAVFKDYEVADQVRARLVRDGFPTDRVDLTASCDMGRAAVGPAESLHGKLTQYFHSLFKNEPGTAYADSLVIRVEGGAATVTVLPRGAIETARATEIISGAGPVDLAQRDLQHQGMERAAADSDTPWISNFFFQGETDSHCIYCRLFEKSTP